MSYAYLKAFGKPYGPVFKDSTDLKTYQNGKIKDFLPRS